MQLNDYVFASPKCTYSSCSLFRTLIYVPSPSGAIPCLYIDGGQTAAESKQKSKVMLYFHGNAEDLGMTYQNVNQMNEVFELRIIAMEYRGYGIYNSQKSSDGLLMDALVVYDYIKHKFKIPESDIIVMGRSLGCTAASWIGSRR